MYIEKTARLAIYAQGEFGKGSSKTAEGVLRYAANPIACVIDAQQKGKSIKEVVGIDCPAPIVGSIQEALEHAPQALLLGTAWSGGALPKAWRQDIMAALAGGMDVVNGLHDFLDEDPEIKAAADKYGKRLFDVRRPPENLPVANGRVMTDCSALVILTVGTDCSVGKMTASLEIEKSATRAGRKSAFVATGQTGIMITGGDGIAIDRVIGDFMAGATEQMVLEAAKKADVVLVEGQGSLAHPGFSGVTLALLHGSCPQGMVLVHNATRDKIKSTDFKMPDIDKLIPVYETMAAYMRPSRIIAIAVNTRGLSEEAARAYLENLSAQTGLPATDPVRYGAEIIWKAIEKLEAELKNKLVRA